jgi:hypothetical protein
MINAISIENFKGIGERVEIELKPITLLFGPNSAGKSTVLHAMQYLRDLLEFEIPDADLTSVSGDTLDLGGYRQFVHMHDTSHAIRIAVTIELDGREKDSFCDLGQAFEPIQRCLVLEEREGAQCELFGAFGRASVALTMRWSEQERAPYLAALEIAGDNQSSGPVEWLARIESDPKGLRRKLTLNSLNSCLERLHSWQPLWDGTAATGDNSVPWHENQTVLEECMALALQTLESSADGGLLISDGGPIVPKGARWLKFEPKSLFETEEAELVDNVTPKEFITSLTAGVAHMLLVPVQAVRERLNGLRTLGPIRKVPDRVFQPVRSMDPARWASGLGAWDRLFQYDAKQLFLINSWLSESNRLATSYEVVIREYVEADYNEPLVRALVDFDAVDVEYGGHSLGVFEGLPVRKRLTIRPVGSRIDLSLADVGVGLSQVLPVVVTALDNGARVVSIEQPELHLHPAVQVGLGDLFIEAAQSQQKMLIIETHSEHLVLRILRRIRETTAGEVPPEVAELRPDELSIIYVQSRDGQMTAKPLRVDETGEFLDRWPNGFFRERESELF